MSWQFFSWKVFKIAKFFFPLMESFSWKVLKLSIDIISNSGIFYLENYKTFH